MHYLKRAFELAEARGYLFYPEVIALRDRIPDWFLALGTERGLAEFKAQNQITVPLSVREFYRLPVLACFLEATIDGEVFLTNMATVFRCKMPPIINVSTAPILAFAFHNHSGQFFGVRLDADDPSIVCLMEGEEEQTLDPVPEEPFSHWIYDAVDSHAARLEYWWRVYEEGQNPNLEWVRKLPGMAARLPPRED